MLILVRYLCLNNPISRDHRRNNPTCTAKSDQKSHQVMHKGISKTWTSSFGSSSHGRWSFKHLFESLSHLRNLSWYLSIFRSLAFHNEASYTYLSYYIYTIQHRHSLVFPHCNRCRCNQISCLQCGR